MSATPSISVKVKVSQTTAGDGQEKKSNPGVNKVNNMSGCPGCLHTVAAYLDRP